MPVAVWSDGLWGNTAFYIHPFGTCRTYVHTHLDKQFHRGSSYIWHGTLCSDQLFIIRRGNLEASVLSSCVCCPDGTSATDLHVFCVFCDANDVCMSVTIVIICMYMCHPLPSLFIVVVTGPTVNIRVCNQDLNKKNQYNQLRAPRVATRTTDNLLLNQLLASRCTVCNAVLSPSISWSLPCYICIDWEKKVMEKEKGTRFIKMLSRR